MSETVPPIRVLLAVADSWARAGICRYLEAAADLAVIGEVDHADYLESAIACRPHVVLLDPALRGMDLTPWLEAHTADMAILLWADVGSPAHHAFLGAALRAGAAGIVARDQAPEQLAAAVRRAAAGEVLLRREQLAQLKWRRKQTESGWQQLTPREREVLACLARGLSNPEIGRELNITPKTVAHHVSRILAKLGASSRTEAALLAVQEGWVRHLP